MHVKYRRAELTCRPLTSLHEVNNFMENPPPWRVLCQELQPHSRQLIRNADVHAGEGELQLESPRAFCHFHPEVEEAPRRDEEELPRTLVCHDMANGYHDDRFVDGTTAHDAYTFYNWAGIDIFCYFSHHFVTVPPLAWINAAHAHGVKVIGTVITESEEVWRELLQADSDEADEAADRLVGALADIAKTLKFDGWLLNVENKIHAPERLVRLVGALHGALHAALPHALLLWYDAVTVEGRLQWQDALNVHNKAFFDACDGIYTNYSWTEEQVARSAAVAAADGRVRDLYVGIDVWGRNFLGGGKFNVQQAVSIAHRHGCSLAIFAPAWTHEALSRGGAAGGEADKIERGAALEYYAKFLVRDRALWGSLWPLLNTRVPARLPFQTSFCRGQGNKRRMYGEVLSPGPWYNPRHMQYQPNAAHGPHGYLLSTKENIKNVSHSTRDKPALPHLRASLNTLVKQRARRGSGAGWHRDVKLRLAYVEDELECLEVFLEDSFLGGSCLKVNPSDAEFPAHRWIRLFHTDFFCEEALIVCVVTKKLRGHDGQTLDVVMRGERGGEGVQVTLLGGARADAGDPPGEGLALLPLRPETAQFKSAHRYLMLHQPQCYVPVENHYGWVVRYFEVATPGVTIRSVNLRTRRPCGPVLLGHVGLCPWRARACGRAVDRSAETSLDELCVCVDRAA